MSVGTLRSPVTLGAPAQARVHRAMPSIAWGRILSDAGRGFAVGLLVMTLVAAAVAGQGFHTRIALLDWSIGIGLVAAPMLLVHVVLRVLSASASRILAFVARRSRPGAARALTLPLALLRFLGRPLTATTMVIPVLVWGSIPDSPLAMYHALFFLEIPIVVGAVVGGLLGVAWGARPLWGHGRPHAATLAIVPALALAGATGAWAILPGDGDELATERPTALAAIAPLDLPDPGAAGPYRVVAATYGSGGGPRPEFAEAATWRTPTVDASRALAARSGIAKLYADWLWGADASRLPINGLAWYPADAPGQRPLVLIVHGNHDAGEFSDPGYAVLSRHLASRGMIAVSVDQNMLNGDPFLDGGGAEQPVRAWLLLRHLEQFRTWNAEAGHALAGRVDLDRVALIGHSRGGEAAAVAAMLEADESIATLAGLPAIPRGFGIRAVVAFAPSDRQYTGPGSPVRLTDVDYLVVQGAHDGIVPAFTGLATYHRIRFTGTGDHLKVALFSQRANHGRFNTVWDTGDAGLLASWMLDRGSLLSMAEQQQLSRAVVGAFLARSLFAEHAYDAFFREPRAGRDWLPDDIVQTHWESSGRAVALGSAGGTTGGATAALEGFDSSAARDPGLRDGAVQGDAATWLTWTGPATYRVPIDDALRARISLSDSLVFSLAPAGSAGATVDATIELRYRSGAATTVALADVAPVRPLFAATVWKADVLGDRYVPSEKVRTRVERFLQTYAIPLAAFAAPVARPGGGPDGLVSVAIHFAGEGAAFIDDLGFEPAVVP